MNMYQDALDSQTACNASGLILTLARHVEEIWQEVRSAGGGTDEFNTHPVVRLFAEQLYYLSSDISYSEASETCHDRVKSASPSL